MSEQIDYQKISNLRELIKKKIDISDYNVIIGIPYINNTPIDDYDGAGYQWSWLEDIKSIDYKIRVEGFIPKMDSLSIETFIVMTNPIAMMGVEIYLHTNIYDKYFGYIKHKDCVFKNNGVYFDTILNFYRNISKEDVNNILNTLSDTLDLVEDEDLITGMTSEDIKEYFNINIDKIHFI